MAKGKTDVYQMVTDRVINMMEKEKELPWRKPWGGVIGDGGAYNRITKKPYSLLNQILLGKTGEWASYKQWEKCGGQVRKGEKGSIVVFWKMIKKTEKIVNEETGEEVEKKTTIPILRYYTVFHISQVDGVKPLQEFKKTEEVKPIESAEKVMREYIERSGVKFEETLSNQACYNPLLDRVSVPVKEQYENLEEYYGTNFHELVHSTGAKKRLDRDMSVDFGGESYSKEELVAELGSSFILNNLGIDTEKSFKNNVAYLESWIKALKDDKRLIVSASSKAEKACKYIMGETAEQAETEEEEQVA